MLSIFELVLPLLLLLLLLLFKMPTLLLSTYELHHDINSIKISLTVVKLKKLARDKNEARYPTAY